MNTITRWAAVATPLAALTMVIPATLPAQATGQGSNQTPSGAGSTDTGHQKRYDIDPVTGGRAITALGNRLEKLAADSDLSPGQLKQVLKSDKTIGVDPDGNLLVSDTLGGTGQTVTTGKPDKLIWAIGQTNYLHSRASSPLKIYLDFNGHVTSGTVWNSAYTGGASFTTPTWGRDSDPATWNTSEAAAIQAAYASVAEDFAPFNVDVTTENPGLEGLRKTSSTDTSYGIRVVVGPNTWLNVTNSGYAQIGSFNWNSDTPAYCFAGSTTPTKQIAECVAHEAGHTVGLYHDGVFGGGDYYAGHNNWAPIMGDSYGKPMTQWSRGQYPNANNQQDDLTVIGNYLGWVRDDYVGTTATTATLPAGTTRSGRLTWGSGELDAFKFTLSSQRRINIQSWEAFQTIDTNLNMRIRLTNSAATVLATSSPTGTTRTNMTVTLNPGTYYVFIDGVGEGSTSTGYSNYDSLGYYNLLLTLV